MLTISAVPIALKRSMMAAARIIGPVGCNRADVFAFGDLAEQLCQNRAVAIAPGGKFHNAGARHLAHPARLTIRIRDGQKS